MNDYARAVQVETTNSIAVKIADLLTAEMKMHGNDPDAIAMTLIAIERAVRMLEKHVNIDFRKVLISQLQQEDAV